MLSSTTRESKNSRLISNSRLYIYIYIVMLYCIGIVAYARYGFNLDDIWMWLNIYEQTPIRDGYRPHIGRFFPLAFLDLNLMMLVTSNPYFYFALNACIVFGVSIALWIMFDEVFAQSKYGLKLLCVVVLFLHPGFVTIMLGICYPERWQIPLLCVFVLASLRFYKHHCFKSAIVGLLAANLALYFKETTFLIIGFFGAFHLYFALKSKEGKLAYFYYISLLISALIFLLLYFCVVYPQITDVYQRGVFLDTYEKFLYFVKGILNFGLNDSFLVVLLSALCVYRIFCIWRLKDREHIFYDSLLFCGFIYMCAFIKLGLFELYYLMPIYFVSGISCLYFLSKCNLFKNLFIKTLCILCMTLWCINTLPIGINNFIFYKIEALKFHSALNFITEIAKSQEKITLYFDGNGRGEKYATWYYGYYPEYLEKIYGISNFDIKSYEPNSPSLWNKKNLWTYDKDSKLSIYNNDEISIPQSGDFIILNNSTNKMADADYLQLMEQTYELVYTSRYFSAPYFGLKPLLKYIFSDSKLVQNATQENKNLFRLPLRDYIYKVN